MADQEPDAVLFDAFSGLRNTIAPERLGPRELARARNVDLDDAGQLRRRRGYRKVSIGRFHSFHPYSAVGALAVKDSMLVCVRPDYRCDPLLAGIGDEPLAYTRVKDTIYASSRTNSFKVDVVTLDVAPWGLVTDHKYQPGLEPAASEWWWSPAPADPDAGLGPVYGKLLAPPPLGQTVAYFNGRIYVGARNVLWATELYLYDWIDKNRGFRQFETDITAIGAVNDGVYVGTMDGLYFLKGSFQNHQLTQVQSGAVIPGTMIEVPADIVNPVGRTRPDVPQQSAAGIACMTSEGQVVGLNGGDVYNLTRTNFIFPRSRQGAALYREQDGINQIVTTLDSGGTPSNNARFGDYCEGAIVRAIDRIPAGSTLTTPSVPDGGSTVPVPDTDRLAVFNVAGDFIGFLEPQ